MCVMTSCEGEWSRLVKRADLLVAHCRELLTLVETEGDMLGIIRDGAVAALDGRIVATGRSNDVARSVTLLPGAVVIHASDRTVMPGFVDAHTHLVHAGSREDEFTRRLAGEDYLEILAAGGGILSTVLATRQASDVELERLAMQRLRQMLAFGTTTAEVKSGYGLDTETELRILRVIQRLQSCQPVSLIPTFLGAHAVPLEYRGCEDEYVDLVCREMIPAVAAEGLAVFCDVFCERGVFNVAQSRRVLATAAAFGLKLRLHADELSDSGGASLAAELRCASADHLTHASTDGLQRMASAGVAAGLLPGASHFLDHPFADARAMLDEHGLKVYLATDYNPGTSPMLSMPAVISLACAKMKMTVAEAVCAATRVPAEVLGVGDVVGTLEVGKTADLLVLNVGDYRQLAYGVGMNPVATVVKSGRVVLSRD